MSEHFIFGYGSLVNRQTHQYHIAHPARLSGWRRIWRHTTRREVAFLNAVPDAGSQIDGLMLGVPRIAPELEKREYAYRRIAVSASVEHPVAGQIEVNLFAISHGDERPPSTDHAVLLSYVDMVVGGYHREFGRDGVDRFFATTDGWDVPILNDRQQPRYPRHVAQPDEVTGIVDAALAHLPCRIVGL